jgi:hypothetical protein
MTFMPVTKCDRCKKREHYVYCFQCASSLCAMCSWTTLATAWTTGNRPTNEHCRPCAGVTW